MSRNVFLTEGSGGDFLIEGTLGPFMMEIIALANPAKIPIPKDTWVKVAENVTSGAIYPLDSGAKYVQTIRDTGDTGPDADDFTEGKEIPWEGAIISDSQPRDVYVAALKQAGEVRVDL